METRYGLKKKRQVRDKPPDARDDAVALFCAGVATLCFAAPLLLTLPQTLDALERLPPAWNEPSAKTTSAHSRDRSATRITREPTVPTTEATSEPEHQGASE